MYVMYLRRGYEVGEEARCAVRNSSIVFPQASYQYKVYISVTPFFIPIASIIYFKLTTLLSVKVSGEDRNQ